MFSAFELFAHLGEYNVPAAAVGPSTSTYVAEDGVTVYVAEDGVSPYVTET